MHSTHIKREPILYDRDYDGVLKPCDHLLFSCVDENRELYCVDAFWVEKFFSFLFPPEKVYTWKSVKLVYQKSFYLSSVVLRYRKNIVEFIINPNEF